MSVEAQIAEYLKDNNIEISFLAENTDINSKRLENCLQGMHKLKASEFVKICTFLNLDLSYFGR